ncbi:MAG: TonB-dependent receptor [Deltaproteobacteria bacterium]|nr:TonB-dependent receptor [Deltaproteobacteria bacterium]
MTFRTSSVAVILLLLSGSASAQPDGAGAPIKDDSKREEVQATQLSKVPKQIVFVDAEYPKEAFDKKIEADVTLLLDIDAQGKVTQVGIAEPSAFPEMGFEEAAMVAANGFLFEPAEINGMPVAVQIGYRYRFLQKVVVPAPEPAPPPTENGETGATPVAPAAPKREPVVNFSGVLLERGTRLKLSGFNVTVFREIEGKTVGYEANSNAEGKFEFFDLDPGDWKVLIEQPGYFPFRTTESVVVGEATSVSYYVEQASYNPYDVTVTAERPRKEVSRTVISAKEIDKVPGTAGDPLAVIQNFAGVARAPAFSGQVIIRGSAPEDSKFFVDGIEVPAIYHFVGLRSVLPIGMLDGIDFYPGNFGPEFGRAIGGIIDVRTKHPKPKKIGGYADISLLDTGLYLEIPVGEKASLALAGRRSYIDAILNAVVPSDASVNLIRAPRYYDYQILGTYRPTPEHELRLFMFASDDKLALLFESPGEADFSLTTGRLSVSNSFQRIILSDKYVPGTRFSNHIRVSAGEDNFDFDAGDLFFKLHWKQFQLRETAEFVATDWLTVRVGSDSAYRTVDGDIRLPPPPKEGEPMVNGPPDFDNSFATKFTNRAAWFPGLFAEGEITAAKGLKIYPGARLEYFSRNEAVLFSPRFTTRYQISDKFLLKGGVGLFVQEPQPDETDDGFGNPRLKQEFAGHYSIGMEYQPRVHLKFDTTAFYKDLFDQVSQTGMLPPNIYNNGGSGRVYGLETVIRHEFFNNFTGWIAYTLSRAERTDFGSTERRLFDYDQTHILTLIASYVLPRNWQIGSRFRLVSGNPITPVDRAVYSASEDRFQPVFGQPNSSREGAFHQLDIRVDKRWIYDAWILGVYLDIQNIYNRANPEGRNYNFDYSDFQPQQGLPILPILGIRGEF